MHCKDISLREVDFPLTERDITDIVSGWDLYVRTEYIVLRNKNDLAVVKVLKDVSENLFRKVTGIEVISLPEETVFVRDPSVDVLNIPALASVQERYLGKTVVVEGMFSHIGFVSGLKPMKLRAIDNTPPGPSRLSNLLEKALSSGLIEIPVIPEYIDLDLGEKVGQVTTEAVMFPCKVSGMKAEIPYYFLDEAPDLEHEVTLIGCALSNRIYQAIYRKEVSLINICPMEAIPSDGRKTIVRCCGIKDGHIVDGNVVKIPWGATVPETIVAINSLFERSE